MKIFKMVTSKKENKKEKRGERDQAIRKEGKRSGL